MVAAKSEKTSLDEFTEKLNDLIEDLEAAKQSKNEEQNRLSPRGYERFNLMINEINQVLNPLKKAKVAADKWSDKEQKIYVGLRFFD